MSVTNFENIRRKGGSNEAFPSKLVYLLGSMERLFQGVPSEWVKNWMTQCREEAAEHEMEVEVHDGHVYLVW